MADAATLTSARRFLNAVGYSDDLLHVEYPVWIPEPPGVESANLVAFTRPVPKDMSTALVVVHLAGPAHAYRIARALGAPFVVTPRLESFQLSIAKPDKLESWRTIDSQSFSEVRRWLQPETAKRIKVGLRQLPLFDIPVNFLADARARSSEHLGSIVGEALSSASDALAGGESGTGREATRAHLEAARLVVGALTALVIRDTDLLDERIGPSSRAAADGVIQRAATRHPTTFEWLRTASGNEQRVLRELTDQLGKSINYRSMDPGILSQVYEHALVNEDERRRLGIHYTPPDLASRILASLPVELIDPGDRHVLDPACGSGSLLVAAHERLYKLQPANWSLDARHRDLQVHLRGHDVDHFAAEIAGLALLLKAQPAGNGWAIETENTLSINPREVSPRIIVMNPPWGYTSKGQRHQRADDFMRWAIAALRPGGLLGAIVPTSWLSADNSEPTRQRLCDQFEIFEIWRLPEGTFSTSRQAASVLFARKKETERVVGNRVVRQIWLDELEVFLEGRPPLASYVVGDSSTSLSDVMPLPPFGEPVRPLEEIAVIRSGPQRRPGVSDRGDGVPYLAKFSDVTPYGEVGDGRLWRLRFPADFEGAWGESVIKRSKVLVSAARSPNNPWRFRVAIDLRGVACSHSVRCVAPRDESDSDLLYALLAVLGSGFASAYAACQGIDRNIPARLMRSFPVPSSGSSMQRLGHLGREASRAAHDSSVLGGVLEEIEEAVWQAYGLDETFRDQAFRLLSGHRAPDGSVRYPASAAAVVQDRSMMRRIGAVLAVDGAKVRIWINGITPDDGVILEVPPRMPGWLVRPGATFDARRIDSIDDIASASFEFQPMSWQTLELGGGAAALAEI